MGSPSSVSAEIGAGSFPEEVIAEPQSVQKPTPGEGNRGKRRVEVDITHPYQKRNSTSNGRIQVKWGRKIASFSPAGLLSEALESTVESGITHYENFQKSARRYQQELASYVDRKYPLDKVSPLNRETTDPVVARMKLDFESIPKFEDRQAPLSDAAGMVLRSAAILALINVVLFAAAFVSFLRYDPR